MPSSLLRIHLFQLALTLFSSFFICGFACQAHAQKASTEEWNISADKIARYEDPNSIVAQGNVILTKREKLPPKKSAAEIKASMWSRLLEEEAKPEITTNKVKKPSTPVYQTTMTIQADWMVYDVDLESIKAKGHVQISTADNQLFAKEGTLNLVSETGNFSNATILNKDNTLHLEGKKIEKTGVDTYRINDGWVITCKLEDHETPPWSFSSSETNVRQDGYAVLRNAKFNIKNVPVFYTPYLLVPVKDTRQTGVLFPEFSSSTNNGFGFDLPFFVNISDSADVTFYPEYFTKRGFMPGAEFRYVLSTSDKGMFTANFLHDKLSDPSETDYYRDTGYTHDNRDRYWIRGKVDQTYADWQTRLDIDVVSDQDYLNEFNSGITGFEKTHNRYLETFGRGFQNKSDTLRENTFKALRTWNGMSLQVDLLAINDADTNASSTNTPLWQLPSIDYSGVIPVDETYFSLGWDANYVDYWREDGIGGHRFDIHPTLSSPIPLSPYLESRAEIGLRDTSYLVQTYGNGEWNNDNIQNRLYPEFEIEVATTLERDFSFFGSSDRTLTHQVRPYLQYGYIPDIDQSHLPHFDDVDRIDGKNGITYGADNYVSIFKGKEGRWSSLYDNAEWKIEQSYDLRDSASDQPFSDIFSELKLRPLPSTYISYKTYYDVYNNKFNRHTFGGLSSDSRGDSLSLDYSFNDEQNIEQINGTILAHLINGWSIGATIEHSISQSETVEAKGFLAYQATCWTVKFETHYTPEDTTYLVLFSLANIGFPLGVGL